MLHFAPRKEETGFKRKTKVGEGGGGGAWLPQSVQHVTQSHGDEFEPHDGHGSLLKNQKRK